MNIWVGMKKYSALYMLYSKSLNEVFNMEGAWYVAHYVSYYYLTPPPPSVERLLHFPPPEHALGSYMT